MVAAGVVVGFPILTSYALTVTPASHGAVVIALLPAATAVAAVLRVGERPGRAFWSFSAAGATAAVSFALLHGGGVGDVGWADLLLFGAVLAAAVGYAEGGTLAREIGSWQTVSWALVVAAPLMITLTAFSAVRQPPSGTLLEWGCFAYLSVVSMFLGFFAWYRGLAIGPMSRVSQVQLVQPIMTIGWAALLLREQVGWLTLAGGLVVIACAGGAVRSRPRPGRTAQRPVNSGGRFSTNARGPSAASDEAKTAAPIRASSAQHSSSCLPSDPRMVASTD